jgi:hypothetical protein
LLLSATACCCLLLAAVCWLFPVNYFLSVPAVCNISLPIFSIHSTVAVMRLSILTIEIIDKLTYLSILTIEIINDLNSVCGISICNPNTGWPLLRHGPAVLL